MFPHLQNFKLPSLADDNTKKITIENSRHGEAETSVRLCPSMDCRAPTVLAMTINILRADNND